MVGGEGTWQFAFYLACKGLAPVKWRGKFSFPSFFPILSWELKKLSFIRIIVPLSKRGEKIEKTGDKKGIKHENLRPHEMYVRYIAMFLINKAFEPMSVYYENLDFRPPFKSALNVLIKSLLHA